MEMFHRHLETTDKGSVNRTGNRQFFILVLPVLGARAVNHHAHLASPIIMLNSEP